MHKTTDKRSAQIEREQKVVDKLYKLPETDANIGEIPAAPVYTDINAQMLGDRFLFQEFPQATVVGTLHMPGMGDIGIDKARIIGVGPDVKTLKVGDIIYKCAGLGETIVTNLGSFRFLPESGAIAIDSKFDGKATAPMKDDNAGV
jgi:hypothetical protein